MSLDAGLAAGRPTPSGAPVRHRARRAVRHAGFWGFGLLLAVAAGVATGASDGPVWRPGADARTPAEPLYVELEAAYRSRLQDTRALLLDPTVFDAGAKAISAHVAARLNADGVYANLYWDAFVAELADRGRGARAVWRPFLGGPHADGVGGYLGTTGVCVVVPPDAPMVDGAAALANVAGGSHERLPQAFWRRVVLIHEFEHCVDADRGAGSHRHPGPIDTALPDGSQTAGAAGGADATVSPRELYADAAAALRLFAEGWPLAAVRRFADLRARAVAVPLTHGRLPPFSHYTAPMLDRLLDDVAAGRLAPAELDDGAVHAAASAYRDAALRAAAGIDLGRLREAMAAGGRNPAALLRQAGAAASWIAPVRHRAAPQVADRRG